MEPSSSAAPELAPEPRKAKPGGCWPRCLKFRKGEHWGLKVLKVAGGVALVAVAVGGVLTIAMVGAAGVLSVAILGAMAAESSSKSEPYRTCQYQDRYGQWWSTMDACPHNRRRYC